MEFASGYVVRAPLTWLLLAFTTVLLGVETVFYSFFLSLLAQSADKDEEWSPSVGRSEIDHSETAATGNPRAEEPQQSESEWGEEPEGPTSTGRTANDSIRSPLHRNPREP